MISVLLMLSYVFAHFNLQSSYPVFTIWGPDPTNIRLIRFFWCSIIQPQKLLSFSLCYSEPVLKPSCLSKPMKFSRLFSHQQFLALRVHSCRVRHLSQMSLYCSSCTPFFLFFYVNLSKFKVNWMQYRLRSNEEGGLDKVTCCWIG